MNVLLDSAGEEILITVISRIGRAVRITSKFVEATIILTEISAVKCKIISLW